MPIDEKTVVSDILIALALVDTAIKAIPQTAAFEPIVALLLGAANNLAKYTGSDVTYSQLEGLRVKV